MRPLKKTGGRGFLWKRYSAIPRQAAGAGFSPGKVTLLPAAENYITPNDGVIGWVRLGATHPDTGRNWDSRNQQITKDALIAADQYINFSQYDANNDGYVDGAELSVVVVVAGYEDSYCGNCAPGIWAHAWYLDDIGVPQLDGKYVGANHGNKGGYAQIGEIHGNNPPHPATLGVMAHELGHLTFDLPDLYDTSKNTPGLLSWCLMSTGEWGAKTGEYLGMTPVIPNAWVRQKLGWETPMNGGSSFSITAAGSAQATAYNSSLRVNTGLGTQYFLVDNRQDLGYDRGLETLVGSSGFGGLAIYHIDETCPDNSNYSCRLVDLEPADNDEAWSTQATDAWRIGTQIHFTPTSAPNSNLNDGSQSGLAIFNISASGEVMTTQTMHLPVVTNIQPKGGITTSPADINVFFADAHNDINPASVVVTLDGNALAGCTVTAAEASCPVYSIAAGLHTIGGSVTDYAGSATTISGRFVVGLSYLMSWYDQQTPGMSNWLMIANPNQNSVGALAFIGNGSTSYKGVYSVNPQGTVAPQYPGVMGGPVEVVSAGTAPALFSQRTLFNNNFNETAAVPQSQLASDYYFTWYDEQTPGMLTWILVTNKGASQAHVEVYIGNMTTPAYTYDLGAGQTITPHYEGTIAGPVRVRCTNGQQLLVSERTTYNGGFSEIMGTPYSSLGSEYSFTWYDEQTPGMYDWLLMSNLSGAPATVEVYIQNMATPIYTNTIQPGQTITPRFQGTMAGPVKVKCTNCTNDQLITSQRTLYQGRFEEVMGLPTSGLFSQSRPAWFPWYDSANGMNSWIMLANTTDQTATADIYIAGQKKNPSPISVAPGSTMPKYFSGVMGGPVKVQVLSGPPLTISQRVLYQNSFNEITGMTP